MKSFLFLWLWVALLVGLGESPLQAADSPIAVAANFTEVAKALGQAYEAKTKQKLVFAFASTGKHAAQIRQGAPFAAFLAADATTPMDLEKEGLALPGTRFSYAQGRLALWSLKAGLKLDAAALKTYPGHRLALANPKLAPYGQATQKTLEKLGLWVVLQEKLVLGENIAQAYQFIYSGNAEMGFVALSQVRHPHKAAEGSYWLVPADLHPPIDQQAVLLKDDPLARGFLEFLKSAEAKTLISRYGYEAP